MSYWYGAGHCVYMFDVCRSLCGYFQKGVNLKHTLSNCRGYQRTTKFRLAAVQSSPLVYHCTSTRTYELLGLTLPACLPARLRGSACAQNPRQNSIARRRRFVRRAQGGLTTITTGKRWTTFWTSGTVLVGSSLTLVNLA